MDILKQINLCGLIPAVRTEAAEKTARLAAALSDAGFPAMGIDFRSPAACEAIARVRRERPEFLIGATEVAGAEAAKRALEAGARFLTTPEPDADVVRLCAKREAVVLPGCVGPSDIEAARALDLRTVCLCPAGALDGAARVEAFAADYPDVRFVPCGDADAADAGDYLALPGVTACVCGWPAFVNAVEAGDGARASALAAETLQAMLGFTLAHVGVNSGSEAEAFRQAEAFCAVLGWPVRPGNSSVFAGTIVEFVKEPWTGTHGHIAIGVNDIDRAWWHMEKRGVTFDWENAKYKNDRLVALYLKEEIGGFAVHLLQK